MDKPELMPSIFILSSKLRPKAAIESTERLFVLTGFRIPHGGAVLKSPKW